MPEPILETHDLAIGYPARRGALRLIVESLHLQLYAGELVCLLGPNGAGKSTLLRTLAGMQPPLRGGVRVAGADPYRLPPRELARRLGVVLTDRAEVGALSVRALVALGRYPYTDWTGRLTPQDETVIDHALAAVGIAAFAPRLVNELSDGERQKVMIARALAQEPKLLLLDEPTAFLDLPRRVELMGLLRRLARESGRAVLLSTHDLDLALRGADRLWLLPPGGPIRAGMPEELVLEGAFQAAFESAGVEFDAHGGHFKVHNPARGCVDLSGSGLPALWTGRALEREGFIINGPDGPRSALHIEVHDRSGQPIWRLRHAETWQDYLTLSQAMSGVKACFSPAITAC
jgi:iron complex transport system ATP-binding protein